MDNFVSNWKIKETEALVQFSRYFTQINSIAYLYFNLKNIYGILRTIFDSFFNLSPSIWKTVTFFSQCDIFILNAREPSP